MRDLPPELAAHLAAEATTLCRCWALVRRDGLALGFTDHDRDLSFDGIQFRARTGVEAADASAELGFAVSGGDISGALTSDGLGEDDLAKGLFDDATVRVWIVNWQDVAQRVLLEASVIGEVRRSDTSFVAELRGMAKGFDEERGRIYSSLCSADLGDARCGYAVTPTLASITTTDGRIGFTCPALAAFTEGTFTGGRVTFTSGASLGFTSEVRQHSSAGGQVTILLWQAAPKTLQPGDTFSLTPGCDKRFATCETRFGNGLNFRGFPHMPGNDFVLAGVRAGDAALDGGSLFR